MSLVEILKIETAPLKVAYIEKTIEFAHKEFARISNITQQQVINEKGYSIAKETYFRPQSDDDKGMRHSKASYALWHRILGTKNAGLEAYVAGKKKMAELHYEASITKLASRIKEKGLDESKLTCDSSHIGVNFDTTITDGTLTVRAFTILAWGEIKCPHYRYLIK